MMWGANSIANLKENLNKIVLDVHDASDDDLAVGPSLTSNGHDSASPPRRNSWTSSRATSHSRSTIANGINSTLDPEIEQYKAEIKRLQSSEAEVKALSVNYAALLKEKEDQILRVNKENGSLKQSLEAKNKAMSTARRESAQVHANGASTKKELADLLDVKNRTEAQTEIKQMKAELQQKLDQLEKMHQKIQEEHQLSEAFREEVNLLKLEREKASKQMSQIQNELSEKISEIKQLKIELNKQEAITGVNSADSLRNAIANLQKENAILKREKNDLESALEISRSYAGQTQSKEPNSLNEAEDSSRSFPLKQEMEELKEKLEKERDKALQQLARLKQHLLEKETEESEKMDEDSKIIEELRERNEYLNSQISRLEKTVKQAVEGQQMLKIANSNEVQTLKKIIDDLNIKLANCMRKIEGKDIELQNLQTALGQYYAEIEAKETLERELTRTREEAARCSQLMKDAYDRVEVSNREKEEVFATLSQTEKTLAEWKGRANKLEEDNAKVRRALEQSMTRLNRMSVESDYLVDRRIVIKLLVTYFQRNHSKEVLDLMVRMLGFSEEEKQRIGVAQQGPGRGVVRGVLGLPGRLVGGILGGSSGEGGAIKGSDNQSFADLWVDFLLTEEERERREAANLQDRSPSVVEHQPSPSHESFPRSGRFSSEFSAVPLTSPDHHTSLPRMLSR